MHHDQWSSALPPTYILFPSIRFLNYEIMIVWMMILMKHILCIILINDRVIVICYRWRRYLFISANTAVEELFVHFRVVPHCGRLDLYVGSSRCRSIPCISVFYHIPPESLGVECNVSLIVRDSIHRRHRCQAGPVPNHTWVFCSMVTQRPQNQYRPAPNATVPRQWAGPICWAHF